MASKRICMQDPEYEEIAAEMHEKKKRRKIMEQGMRLQVKQKIETIIRNQFQQELLNKDIEIDKCDDALHDSQSILHRLRACIVAKYYREPDLSQISSENTMSYIHPAVRKYLGKSPKFEVDYKKYSVSKAENSVVSSSHPIKSKQMEYEQLMTTDTESNAEIIVHPQAQMNVDLKSSTQKVKSNFTIVIGNVSKFIPASERTSSHLTHLWKAYVRDGRKGYPSQLSNHVQKVCFLLHPSFRPDDVIEVKSYPFEISKPGWGDFSLRVQITFLDPCNKPIDIIHQLTLDKTYTGLTTLGPETHVEVSLLVREDIPMTYESKTLKQELCTDVLKQGYSSVLAKSETMEELGMCVNNLSSENVSCSTDYVEDIGAVSEGESASIAYPSSVQSQVVSQLMVQDSTQFLCEQNSVNKNCAIEMERKENVDNELSQNAQLSTSCTDLMDSLPEVLNINSAAAPAQKTVVNKSATDVIEKKESVNDSVAKSLYEENPVSLPSKLQTNSESFSASTSAMQSDAGKSNDCATHADTQGRAFVFVPHSPLVRLKPVVNDSEGSHVSCQEIPMAGSETVEQNLSERGADTHTFLTKEKDSIEQCINTQKLNTVLPGQPLYVLKFLSGGQKHDGSKQLILLPASDDRKMMTAGTFLPNSDKANITPNCFTNLDAFNKLASSDSSENLLEKTRISSYVHWQQSLKDVNISDCTDFSKLLRKVINVFPLINQFADHSILPFRFASLEDFLSSNVGKRHAAEWQRAGVVRTAALHLMQDRQNDYLKPEDIWSRKQIMIWCRRYGYTPELLHEKTNSAVLQDSSVGALDDTTYSDFNELLPVFENDRLGTSDEEGYVELQIVDDEKPVPLKDDMTSPLKDSAPVCLPCSSEAVEFVKNTISEIFIPLKPIELEPGVSALIVEEMILSACKEFATDIIRSSVNQCYRRAGGKMSSGQVALLDVYSAIKETSEFQFLTNKFLGTVKESKIKCN